MPVIALLPWLVHPTLDRVVCWKESQVNSVARRAWTDGAARLLESNYQPGSGILAGFGDLTGIFCQARIPLHEVIHEGSGPIWDISITRPDLLHAAAWGIAQRNTRSDKALHGATAYTRYESIETPGAPPLDVFYRTYAENPVH